MKILLTKHGIEDNLRVEHGEDEIPTDEDLKDTDVLVEVKVCGVNFADIYNRRGLPTCEEAARSFPLVCGIECVGIVKAIGENVEEFKAGDHVACFKGIYGGMWKSYIVLDMKFCHLLPKEIPLEDGANLCVNYGTAYHTLFIQGNLRPGSTVLIDSAGGGFGCAMTQLAKTVEGVKIIGLASAHKHSMIIENGVDEAIDYNTEDYVSRIKDLCPEGVDLIVDMQSGYKFTEKLSLLSPLGRIIHTGAFAMMSQSSSFWSILKSWWGLKNIRVLDLIMGNLNVSGFNLTTLVQKQPERQKMVMKEIVKLYMEEKIKPKIDSIYSFEEVNEAYKRIEDRKNIGKVLLVPKKD